MTCGPEGLEPSVVPDRFVVGSSLLPGLASFGEIGRECGNEYRGPLKGSHQLDGPNLGVIPCLSPISHRSQVLLCGFPRNMKLQSPVIANSEEGWGAQMPLQAGRSPFSKQENDEGPFPFLEGAPKWLFPVGFPLNQPQKAKKGRL